MVLQLRLENRAGAIEPISALVSLEVFLSKPGIIPSQVAVALAHEDGFKGEMPFVDWRSWWHDQVDLEKGRELEMVPAIGGPSAVEGSAAELQHKLGVRHVLGSLSFAGNLAPLCPSGDSSGLNLAHSAYNDPCKCQRRRKTWPRGGAIVGHPGVWRGVPARRGSGSNWPSPAPW